jgi:hypothetical protein
VLLRGASKVVKLDDKKYGGTPSPPIRAASN